MGKVLKAVADVENPDTGRNDAWIQKSFAGQSDLWLTYEIRFTAAQLAYWLGIGGSGPGPDFHHLQSTLQPQTGATEPVWASSVGDDDGIFDWNQMVYFSPPSSFPPVTVSTWAPATAYPADGSIAIIEDGSVWIVSTAGTSDGSEPDWASEPGYGVDLTDGTVQWERVYRYIGPWAPFTTLDYTLPGFGFATTPSVPDGSIFRSGGGPPVDWDLFLLGDDGTNGFGWRDSYESGGTPTGDAYHLIEHHYVAGGDIDVYIDGTLTLHIPSGGFVDVFGLRLGQDLYAEGADPDPGPDPIYFRHPRIGTTRGGSDVFADDFSSGDLSAWDLTVGDVSVVDDPYPASVPYFIVRVGGDLKIDGVLSDGASVGGYLGRAGATAWFAWIEDTDSAGPKVRRLVSGDWADVGTGDPATDLELSATGNTRPVTAASHVLWVDGDGVHVAYWNGTAWEDRSAGAQPVSDIEYSVAIDAAGRLNLFAPDGIYRWDGAAFARVGDAFAGTWPEEGDGAGFTGSLITHPTDPDKLALVVANNAADGSVDAEVAVAVFFFDTGTWSEAVTCTRDDATLFEQPGATPGTLHTCQAAVAIDAAIYIASSYEADGQLDGPVSVLTLPWGGDTIAPWPAAAPANKAIPDGKGVYLDSAGIPTIAVNAAGVVAVAYLASTATDYAWPPDDTDTKPTVAWSDGGAWLFQQPDADGAEFGGRVQVIPGTAVSLAADGFLVAHADGDDESGVAWRVYELTRLDGEGDDVPADGICVAFETETFGLDQLWTRLDDPDA